MTKSDPNIPPHHHDAERGVIGSLLANPRETIPQIGRLLRADEFHHPAHRTIFDAILALWAENQALDFILVTDALRRAGKLESVGSAAYITELFAEVPSSANLVLYAEKVRTGAALRAIWQTCRAAAAAAARQATPPNLRPRSARCLPTSPPPAPPPR